MALFSKAKGGSKEKDKLMEILAFVVKATQSETGGGNLPLTAYEKMEKLEPGLIAKRAGAEPDPTGNISVYATSKGIAALNSEKGTSQPEANASDATNGEASETPQFVIEQGFVAPEAKRGGIRATIYPFDKMNVGDSFFVAATADRANPAKQLASTVSSATKRFKAEGRKYIVRARTQADGEKANGARIYRTK